MRKQAKSSTLKSPPKWAEKLLYWFSKDEQVEFLAGDLAELFERRSNNSGVTKARFSYIKDVFDMLRPFNLLKNKKPKTTIDMYKN